ncbi:BON domain-containing protein [Telmatocola sphagniphila]|uniref:BON domain-containing protein n=1 Tax=Telmatocola sphagniphila TaxID=1123043 RepID=A0A8E6EZS2_9BACT|nr:BON domain-containing protein [Telmatocola sphagniphila]QVL34043.1 BON domain-containing protein [Telmatocola sphagniphila]
MKTDAQLKTEMMYEIKWDPRASTAQIDVTVVDGIVTLTGSVSSFAERWAVDGAALRVEGVKGLTKAITIRLNSQETRFDIPNAAANLRK